MPNDEAFKNLYTGAEIGAPHFKTTSKPETNKTILIQKLTA